jgi:hypothetical protein
MKINNLVLATFIVLLSSTAQGQDPIYVDETDSRLGPDSFAGVRADIGDVDGDGDLDVLVANGQHTAPPIISPQDIMLQINDGTGVFTDEASTRLPPSARAQQLANATILFDVDGDLDLDVYVANGSSGGILCPTPASQNLLWINDGSGHFTDETFRLPTNWDCSLDATFGDIDNDGDNDIVVANVGYGGLGEGNRILINDLDNSGLFLDRTSSWLPVWPADITYTIALGDLDGDNDLDMVVGNWLFSSPLSRVLINNAGTFTDAPPPIGFFHGWSIPVFDVKLADIDGEGSLDILFTDAANGLRIHPFINDGAGAFTFGGYIYVFGHYGLALADVNHDNRRDMLVTTPGRYYAHSLLLNDWGNTPSFYDVTYLQMPAPLGPATVRYPSFGDFNNDGAVDIYIPTWWSDPPESQGQDRLLINTMVPEQEIEVDIDIKFCSDPNAFNCKKKGVLPVTIFGTETLAALDLEVSTLRLCTADLLNCTNAPVEHSMADRGDPDSDIGAAQCAIIEVVDGVFAEQDYLTADGYPDLDVAFNASEIQDMLDVFCDGAKNTASESLVITGLTGDGMTIYSVPSDSPGIDQLWKSSK